MIYRFDALASTNTQMASMADSLGHGDVVVCRKQTAGRGQRGNSWEAEPGSNLTFSLLLRPQVIMAKDAFIMSMAVSVGITKALRKMLGREVSVKWPNDIYVDDRKLAGILIENSFSGQNIGHAIVGIGLNVNQRVFRSDAPNPVSMANLAGEEFDLDSVLASVVKGILDEFNACEKCGEYAELVKEYHSMLWRRKGVHPWHDCLTGEQITAAISRVEPSGHLVLATNPERTYAFKEVSAIL